jgi:regulator of replication initiation timing
MKQLFLSCAMAMAILMPTIGSGNDDLRKKINQLEGSFANLQQQINQLKAQLGTDVSSRNAQRIASLEAYAVQLHEVLTEIQEQVEDNNTEVTRISKIQQTQPNIGIYGTITAGKSSDQNSVIDGQSFELVISGQPHDRISYFTELEFERAATVGGSRGGEVLLEQAYTDFEINSWLNFRGGILLVPFGNIERDHFSPLREVISKPYTSFALAPSDWTDNGFGFNGRFNVSENWIADYQAYVIAGLSSGLTTTGLRATRQGFGIDNNNNKAIAAKLSLQNTSGITVGFSVYNGAWNADGSKDITGFNVDFDYHWNWFDIVGEYTRMDVDRETGGSAIMDGYYIRTVYSLENLFSTNWLGDDFSHAKLSFVTQYDQVNIENFFDVNLADNWEKRYTIGLRLQPTSSWILSLNYENTDDAGLDTILRGDASNWILSMGYVF